MTIDLAGSESPDTSKGLQSENYLEGKAINQSLVELGTIFRQMKEGKKPPFGASLEFTRYLQRIIGAWFENSKLVMVCHVSAEKLHETPTDSTLQRAVEATQIEKKTVAQPAINQPNQQQQGKK